MAIFFIILIVVVACYVLIATAYQIGLALGYIFRKRRITADLEGSIRFAILVPAHNEELLIGRFCDNVTSIAYQKDLFEVFVIADNCTDGTEDICKKYPVNLLVRQDSKKRGKGYALEWAVSKIDLESYDALLIIDADTFVDEYILAQLRKYIAAGEVAIQCYIDVPNRDESWFTEIISLSRLINNRFYHEAKYRLGLSAYLMGTGMCFSVPLLRSMNWNAYSLSEDWEYYAKLLSNGYKVAFAADAIVFQQESSNLKQATTQRLRWASGRFYVLKALGFNLFVDGLKRRSLVKIDGSLALLLPNWSLQINLILFLLVGTFLLPISIFQKAMFVVVSILLTSQILVVVGGVLLSRNPMGTAKAVVFAPIFLGWKLLIDLACITGLYKGREWVRTKRHIPK